MQTACLVYTRHKPLLLPTAINLERVVEARGQQSVVWSWDKPLKSISWTRRGIPLRSVGDLWICVWSVRKHAKWWRQFILEYNGENGLDTTDIAVLDALVSGGTVLSLKAHFIDVLPDISPMTATLRYLNLSFNNLQVRLSCTEIIPNLYSNNWGSLWQESICTLWLLVTLIGSEKNQCQGECHKEWTTCCKISWESWHLCSLRINFFLYVF